MAALQRQGSRRLLHIPVQEHWRLVAEVGDIAHDPCTFGSCESFPGLVLGGPENIRAEGVDWLSSIWPRCEFPDVPPRDSVLRPFLQDSRHVFVDIVCDVVLRVCVVGEDDRDDEGHFFRLLSCRIVLRGVTKSCVPADVRKRRIAMMMFVQADQHKMTIA